MLCPALSRFRGVAWKPRPLLPSSQQARLVPGSMGRSRAIAIVIHGGIMSTPNPQFPQRPQSNVSWPLIAVAVAVLILGVFIFYLPRVPRRGPNPTTAEVPPQPFGQTIQITDLKIQPSPVGGNIYIQ